ncbi:MAG TPA: cupin domain-containing protein [Micromonosporaceae bacterium]
MQGSALRRCVAVDESRFLTSYWGSRPLLSPAERLPTGFTDLLDLPGVDDLLSRRGLRTPFLRVARDGRVVPADRYTGSGGAGAEIADQVLDERVLALYEDGATLVLQGLHRLWPPVVDFAGALAGQLRHPVQVNAYLTPPGNRGFAAHYDTHDVFVLQVAGAKRWRVHPPVVPDPLERQPWGGVADEVAASADTPPALDVVLRPGDALYLPRGWLHSAQALGEQSLHLTVGVRTITRYALVEALLDLAAEEPRLRRSVPPGVEVADPDQVADELAATVEALRDWLTKADPVAVAERLRRRYWAASRPAPIRPVAQAAAVRAVDGDTRLAVRPGLRWRLVDTAPDRVAVQVFDRSLDVPSFCAPALRALLAGEVSRVADLPGLDRDDQVTLARRLLREAFVVPAR